MNKEKKKILLFAVLIALIVIFSNLTGSLITYVALSNTIEEKTPVNASSIKDIQEEGIYLQKHNLKLQEENQRLKNKFKRVEPVVIDLNNKVSDLEIELNKSKEAYNKKKSHNRRLLRKIRKYENYYKNKRR